MEPENVCFQMFSKIVSFFQGSIFRFLSDGIFGSFQGVWDMAAAKFLPLDINSPCWGLGVDTVLIFDPKKWLTSIRIHHKHQPLPWIKSRLKIARYCPLVIQGFSNVLGSCFKWLWQTPSIRPGFHLHETLPTGRRSQPLSIYYWYTPVI